MQHVCHLFHPLFMTKRIQHLPLCHHHLCHPGQHHPLAVTFRHLLPLVSINNNNNNNILLLLVQLQVVVLVEYCLHQAQLVCHPFTFTFIIQNLAWNQLCFSCQLLEKLIKAVDK
ncbi:hypothetical protein LRAMOSA04004 [Lichtheimia ramosa]|uniref:Uncharacterized protein n=1 Tax=Lichtheimia ramosa TaxID=688394 RepID=A0A077WVT6_9FUNG|nr:hypothetical protein LRAMOSA04004 [Lichtheimia ramosa]